MPKRKSNRTRKTKKHNVLKRGITHIENEISHISPILNRKTLELKVVDNYEEFYQLMIHRKWATMTRGQKQAVAYHIENNKIFSVEGKVIDFMLPKATRYEEIDFNHPSIKSLPKAFVMDFSECKNMFTCDDNQWDIPTAELKGRWSFQTAINSVLVFFTNKEGDLCEINSTSDVNIIAKYRHNPSVDTEEEDPMYVKWRDTVDVRIGLQHLLFDKEDAFRSWQSEDGEDIPANYSFQTLEEVRLPWIDQICDDLGIEEHARESYSNAYLRAVGSNLFGDVFNTTVNAYANEDQAINLMRKCLLTPIIGGEYKDNILLCRRLLVKNLVFSFLKALSKDILFPKRTLGAHPLTLSRKKNRNNSDPSLKPYIYITIDADKLLTLRRERKSSVRKSEQYQTQVEKTMGYRWVKENTPKGLMDNEDIYDIMESKTGAILYKVKRPVSGYTRNAHLPKRDPNKDTAPQKVVRVKNII